MSDWKDHYDTLGVPGNATEEKIREQHRRLMKENHPDKHHDITAEKRKKLNKIAAELNLARDVLTDSKKRKEFDQQRQSRKKPDRPTRPQPKPTPKPPRPHTRPLAEFKVRQLVVGIVVEFRHPRAVIRINGGRTVHLRFYVDWNTACYNYLPGEFIKVVVLQIDHENEVLIVSHCMDKQGDTLNKLNKGQIVKGVVKAIDHNNKQIILFVEGITALLRFRDIDRIVAVDEEIEVEILGIDRERSILMVGQIQLESKGNVEKLKPREILQVTASEVTEGGVFVSFQHGLRGYIRAKDLAWYRVNDAREFVAPGDRIPAKILEVHVKDSHVFLGTKQITERWRREKIKRLKIGEILLARVSKKIGSGVVVEIGEMLDALLNDNDLNDCYPGFGRDKLLLRAKIKVKVLKIDYSRLHVSIVPHREK